MSELDTVDLQTIEENVLQLKPSASCLHPKLSDFFKAVVNSVLQQIINCSLQSGEFPKPQNVAAIKPLLKKRMLDTCESANYPKPPFHSQDF